MDHWLKQLREEVNLTQDDLAARLQLEGIKKVSRSAVSNWEAGLSNVPLRNPEFVKALANTLRITETRLMLMAGYTVGAKHTDLAERAAHIIDELPPDKQELAVRLVEQLKR